MIVPFAALGETKCLAEHLHCGTSFCHLAIENLLIVNGAFPFSLVVFICTRAEMGQPKKEDVHYGFEHMWL